ncbi:MAG TPA: diacylglycerol kinase family protein [Acidimicrobiia bacterium]|nr:diacylglycerol kinase family protein [Acidimicrobiia bacterium]
MKRLLLVANPAASGFTGGLFRTITSMLADSYEIEPSWPVSPEEVRLVSAKAAADGFDVVVGFGGDGVVHHVANGLTGTETSLGIIPAGTTNVLARILDIPNRPRKAAELLIGDVHRIFAPMARVELGDPPATSHATFGTGIGYDAEVVERSEAQPYRKYWFGSVHYARSAVSALLGDYRRRKPHLHVTDGVRSLAAVTVLAQVHAPYTYFGQMPLGAPASNGLTVIVFEGLPLRRAPSILMRALRNGRLDKVRGVHVWRDVQQITVEADPEEAAQADGEMLGRSGHIVITAEPAALNVIVPRPESTGTS